MKGSLSTNMHTDLALSPHRSELCHSLCRSAQTACEPLLSCSRSRDTSCPLVRKKAQNIYIPMQLAVFQQSAGKHGEEPIPEFYQYLMKMFAVEKQNHYSFVTCILSFTFLYSYISITSFSPSKCNTK